MSVAFSLEERKHTWTGLVAYRGTTAQGPLEPGVDLRLTWPGFLASRLDTTAAH